jgi:hypothetical protein
MKRRDVLKAFGAAAGAASASRLLAACGGGGGAGKIDTFIYLMMENRSYDHYLGARAFEGNAGDGLVAGMSNPTTDGGSEELWLATEEYMCLPDPPHGWDAAHLAFNGGACDGFTRAYEADHGVGAIGAMQYMDRSRLPVTYALADQYTICDRWFSSVMGPTQPNRAYWLAGQSLGEDDDDGIIGADWSQVPFIFTRLDQAGVDWTIYYSDVTTSAASAAAADCPAVSGPVRCANAPARRKMARRRRAPELSWLAWRPPRNLRPMLTSRRCLNISSARSSMASWSYRRDRACSTALLPVRSRITWTITSAEVVVARRDGSSSSSPSCTWVPTSLSPMLPAGVGNVRPPKPRPWVSRSCPTGYARYCRHRLSGSIVRRRWRSTHGPA